MRFKVGDLIRANDLNRPEVIKQLGIGIVTGDTGWQEGMELGEHGVLVQWPDKSKPTHQYSLYFERVPCK